MYNKTVNINTNSCDLNNKIDIGDGINDGIYISNTWICHLIVLIFKCVGISGEVEKHERNDLRNGARNLYPLL